MDEDNPKTVMEALDERFAKHEAFMEMQFAKHKASMEALLRGVQATIHGLTAAHRGAAGTLLPSGVLEATRSAEQALEDMSRTPPHQRQPQPQLFSSWGKYSSMVEVCHAYHYPLVASHQKLLYLPGLCIVGCLHERRIGSRL